MSPKVIKPDERFGEGGSAKSGLVEWEVLQGIPVEARSVHDMAANLTELEIQKTRRNRSQRRKRVA